jgi:N-acetylglucosamine-6-phosphate deacetylase
MRTKITASSLWDGERLLANPVIEIEDGQIASIASGDADGKSASAGSGVGPFAGATIAPAFFDVHIHGAASHDVMEATPEALGTIGRFLATRGTGSYLATTMTAPLDATLRSLEGLADLIEHPEKIEKSAKAAHQTAFPIGIHLEGPFVSAAKCGVQPKEYLQPTDPAIFDRFYEAAKGHIRLMTVAPELEGAAEFVRHATARGVRVSLGHSDATAEQTYAAIEAGAASGTHTFNAMRALNHREPGILGVVLTCDKIYAELICDGIHSRPEMAKLWWRAKGAERAILITDAMSAAGMPDGEYHLGGFPVQVANGRAMARGVLAGSVLTLDRALANFVEFTDAPLERALRLLTVNPATMAGFADRVGKLAVGREANMVDVNERGKLIAAIRNGETVASYSAA